MVLIYSGGALRAPRNPGLRPGIRKFSIFFGLAFSELQTTYAHLELVQDVSEYEFDALSSHLQSVALRGAQLSVHPPILAPCLAQLGLS